MELIELDATAQRALELLTNAGMSDGSIYDYTHTGFGSILRHFHTKGILYATAEMLDNFLLEQRVLLDQGDISQWKWGLVRRSCELLKQCAAMNSIDLPDLQPWDPVWNRPKQIIQHDAPTAKQFAESENIYVLVWMVNKRMEQLGLSENTVRHYTEEGLAAILKKHYDSGTESYSDKLISQLTEERRLQYEQGKVGRTTYQNLRKAAVMCLNDQGGNVMGVSHDVSGTLRAQEHGHQPSILDMSHACDVIRDCGEVAPSLQARMGTGGNQIPLTYQMQGFGDYREGDVASSCKQRDFKDSTDLVCSVDCRNFTEGGEINGTLQAKESGGQSLNLNNTVRQNMVVRRLTPLECERLQGFPDGWTDIGDWVKTDKRGRKIKVKGSADSPRYKALGNSIALPPWKWLLKRLCGNYERDATMASLFDGIGGFPLVWEQLNGRGTCLWASEIEEFPIAVTKRRFGTLEEQGDMGCFLFPCGKDEL